LILSRPRAHSVTDTVVDGFKMCPSAPMTTSCHLRCAPELQPPSPPALAPPPPAAAAAGGEPADAPGRFCVGPGTVMYMEGFAWSTFGTRRGGHGGGRARPECVSFLFRGWALDSRAKFGAGCAGCVLLGLLAEGIALLRVYVHDASALTDAAADGRGGGARGRWRGWRRGAALGCHCAQLVVGYLLMLVVMSFSYELFAAAVGGLTLGHALTERARERAGGGGGGGTLDPCCPQPPASEARGRSGAYDESLPASVVVRLGDVAHADEAADRTLMLAGTPRSSEPSDWPHAAQPPPRSRAQPTSSSAAASTTVEFAVRGMVCGRCTARVSAALADALAAAGVTDVSVHVNLESERALLLGSVHRLRALRTAELSAAVVAQGYECSVMAEPGMAATMGE
jgi:copper chaperone CopZ